MRTFTPRGWDECDYRAALEQKRLEWETHAATLKARGQAVPPMPEHAYMELCEPQKVRAVDLILTYELLEADTAKLRATASLTAPPAKPAQAASAPQKAAAHAGPQPITAEEAARMTATELCLAAKAGRKLPAQPRFTGATAEAIAARAKNR